MSLTHTNTHKILTLTSLALVLFALHANAEEQPDDDDQWSFLSVKFVRGFTASLTAILVSEIGDKTFFIAAIMSMVSAEVVGDKKKCLGFERLIAIN